VESASAKGPVELDAAGETAEAGPRFTDPELVELVEQANVPLPRGEPRRLVAEVEFSEWTDDDLRKRAQESIEAKADSEMPHGTPRTARTSSVA